MAAHFVQETAQRLARPIPHLTTAHLKALRSYSWPGNIRELQNVIERALILSHDGMLHFDFADAATLYPHSQARPPYTRKQILEAQRESIEEALNKTGGRIYGPGGAAERLGIRPTTLASKIAALGIKRRKE